MKCNHSNWDHDWQMCRTCKMTLRRLENPKLKKRDEKWMRLRQIAETNARDFAGRIATSALGDVNRASITLLSILYEGQIESELVWSGLACSTGMVCR